MLIYSFNKSNDKGNLNGFDLVDDPCFLLRSSDLFPLYVTKDFERQFGLTKEQFKNDVLCLSPKLPEKQAKQLRKEYNAWDGKSPIRMDIEPIGMDGLLPPFCDKERQDGPVPLPGYHGGKETA